MKLADYLFQRLHQLGVKSMHGVPGDFNLTLLDYVQPNNLLWVGNANELNAAYAADGYARLTGLGALVTTFGVGELSAINAIAGAYAERVPVVHIVGIPTRAQINGRALVHHTFCDGEFGRFSDMAARVTAAQTRLLDARVACDEIDRVIATCMRESRPVYIEVPVDMVGAEVDGSALKTPITIPDAIPSSNVDAALEKILAKVKEAKKPMILIDGETRPMGMIEGVEKIMKATNWPTFTTCFGKGLVDETVANFHGINMGAFDLQERQDFIKDVDLVFSYGPHNSWTNTHAYTSIPNPDITVAFQDTKLIIGGDIIRDVPVKVITDRLLESFAAESFDKYDTYPTISRDYAIPYDDVSDNDILAQDRLWHVMANFLRPNDVLLAETGTPGYGAREMPLPKGARLFNPATWLSIGYMLPATQGAALARRDQSASGEDARTILLIGDGSFQMTAQELGTIVAHNLDVVVFLINNAGYTIERCIHGREQTYNDVADWRYLEAPKFFGAKEDTFTARAKTYGELKSILQDKRMSDGMGLRMVEIMLDKDDAPRGPLVGLMAKQKGN